MTSDRRIDVRQVLAARWILLSSSIAAAQSQPSREVAAQVSTQCWIVLGGGEFKRRFESITANARMHLPPPLARC
jgi:hypothetical protein